MLPPKVCLLASLASILCGELVTAMPQQTAAPLRRRQDSTDTVESNDQEDPNVSIDNTDKLRKAVDASTLYTNLATQTYSQISIGPSPTDAVFTVFETVGTGFYPKPPSDDLQGKPSGSNGENSWNIDHILELQVLGYAFSSPATRPTDGATSIPTDVWTSVSRAVNGAASASCTALAKVITVGDNLEGIPKQVNGFKQQVFTGRLLNQPNNPSGNTYYTDFGKAVQKVLTNRQNDMNNLIGDIGDELSRIGGGNAAVKTYWTNFAKTTYQDCIDFLDNWTGLTYPRSSASSTASTAAVTPNSTPTGNGTLPAPTTCYHAADPQNTCAAIADSPGWCDCGDSDASYKVQPTGQPCIYSTTPSPTFWFCPTSTS
ncbi:hypothetical protein ACLMJK_006117 [Lecanora helva]